MYPPHHLGGYELLWQDAVERLGAAGNQVAVLTTDYRHPGARPVDEPGVRREFDWYWREHEFPRLSARRRWQLERRNARILAEEVDRCEPDLIAWWAMGGMSLSLLEQAHCRGIPSVAVVCDDWLLYGPRTDQWSRALAGRPRLGIFVERFTGLPASVRPDSAVDGWVFMSETLLRRARDQGFASPRTQVSYVGPDPVFSAAPAEPWRGRLLYVGRLDERKGIDLAIRAMAELPGMSLTIRGDGDESILDSLRQLVRGLDLGDRVAFLPAAPRDQLQAAYADADAVLFPVRWEEPWGLVPLEAMAVGRPVVATGRGGSGEYLAHERNSLLFDPDEGEGGLVAAVRRLATDVGLRDALIAGGRATAARFDPGGLAEGLLAMSEQVVTQ